ncbi:MAG: transcriptional regulator [Brevinematales bacterium]|nr:transcriptional regulator [Brevinematales bacterium]
MNFDLDKNIHEKARLVIMIALAVSPEKKLSFNELKDITKLSSGNLSVQIRNLEEVGYINVKKFFDNSKPKTEIVITDRGKRALENYLDNVERIVKVYKEVKSL